MQDTLPDNLNIQYSYESIERLQNRNETSDFCRSGRITFDLPSCGIKQCEKKDLKQVRTSKRVVPALNFVSNHVYNPQIKQIQMKVFNKNKNTKI